MPHFRDTSDDHFLPESLVRVGVAREEAEAAHWVEALARSGIEAAVEIADGAAVAPGRMTWTGQFFVYPVLVPAPDRERAEHVLGALVDASEGRRPANALAPVAAIVGLVLLLVVVLVLRGN
jgi:hypothetical protein